MKKKVLLFEAYPVFSGAQRASLNFCKVLRQNDYHITLMLADDPTGILAEKFGPYVDEIVQMNTNKRLTTYGKADQWFNPFTFVRVFFTALLPFFFDCLRIFSKGNFDFFYFCDPRGSAMISVPAFFFRGKKIMYLQSKNRINPLISRLLYMTFTDHVVCPSEDVKNSLPPSRKTVVINYGIDFTQYARVDEARVRHELPQVLSPAHHSRTKLLYAGLIKPQKGLHHLIDALGTLKPQMADAQFPVLLLLGEPSNPAEVAFKRVLVERCRQTGIEPFIYWLGWKDNVLEWMRNADYFVFPTIDKEICSFEGYDRIIESTEGSPVVLIESSLCGLFAVTSRVTGVTDTIVENANGLTYDPNEPDGLTACLKLVLVEKPRFQGFPTQRKFSLDTFATKFLTLLGQSPAAVVETQSPTCAHPVPSQV